jgi:hypothetical protein
MAAVRIGGLLERAVERWGAGTQVRAARVVHEANSILQGMFGDDIGQYVRAAAYRRGELVCECNNPSAGMALRQREQGLLDELKRRFPNIQFDRVQIRTGA